MLTLPPAVRIYFATTPINPCVSMMGETDLVNKPPPGHERFSHGRDPNQFPSAAV